MQYSLRETTGMRFNALTTGAIRSAQMGFPVAG